MSLPPPSPQLLRYRTLSSPRLGPWHGSIAIARSSLRLLAGRKMFWTLYVFSLLIFLLYFFGRQRAAQVEVTGPAEAVAAVHRTHFGM